MGKAISIGDAYVLNEPSGKIPAGAVVSVVALHGSIATIKSGDWVSSAQLRNLMPAENLWIYVANAARQGTFLMVVVAPNKEAARQVMNAQVLDSCFYPDRLHLLNTEDVRSYEPKDWGSFVTIYSWL